MQPGQASESKTGAMDAPAGTGDGLAAAADSVEEDWGKLPPKVAKDLMEAQRSGVSPEYRNAIESYYKAIAERARRKQK